MKRLLLYSAFLASGLMGLQDLATAHGGTYRGPGDTVPPGGGGGGGGGGPANPGPGGPAAPGPGGPTSPGPTSPGAPPGAPGGGNAGGPTTGGGGGGQDLTIWDFWWGFNKEPYLNLRAQIHSEGVITGSDEFFLGQGERDQAKNTLRPSEAQIRGQVVPALLRALDKERSNDILTGAMIALAKIGDAQDESGESAFEAAISRFLADSVQEIAETAAVSLGILANDVSVPTLVHLVKDTERGRELVGKKAEVPYRTRAFAAYGLGLIGYRTANNEVRQDIAAHLVEILEMPTFATRDIKVAAMTALGLTPVAAAADPAQASTEAVGRTFTTESEEHGIALSEKAKAAASSRQAQLDFLIAYFDEDNRRANTTTRHEFVIAHAPRAMGKLLEDLPMELREQYKTKVWGTLKKAVGRASKERMEITQGVILALGQIADADGDEIDAEIRGEIQRLVKDGAQQQDRFFAMMSLAQAGSKQGTGEEPWQGVEEARSELIKQMTRGKGQTAPWAALALGVFGEQLLSFERTVDVATSSALREETAKCSRPAEIGAYALALGLRRDLEGMEILLDKLENIGPDEARGYCAVGLGLMKDGRAIEPIQAVVKDSKYRPELIKQAAIGLGLLGDKELVEELVKMLQEAQGLAPQAAIASALGTIGDSRSIEPLIAMLDSKDYTDTARGFAAVALGIVCDKEPLPWNTKIAVDINYRANTLTLTGEGGTGILDIL